MITKLFSSNKEETKEPQRFTGKIIHLDKGWGFISSRDIEYTRIFFHWTGLNQNLHFNTLSKGMQVEFEAKHWEDSGWRAIKIKAVTAE